MRAGIVTLLAAVTLSSAPLGGAAAEEVSDTTATARVLELSEQGFVHCSRPNVGQKTCRTLDTYERIRDGMYNSTTLMAAGPGTTLEIYTPVWIVDGALCGSLREQDVTTGIVRRNGREVAAQLVAPALRRVLDDNRELIDKPFCVWFERASADYVARVAIDGVRRPDFDVPIKLVGPSEGYKVVR